MKNLKSYILPCIFLTVVSSCRFQSMFPNYERCVHLGNNILCTDSRISTPPKDCMRYGDEEHVYTCPTQKLIGYQCTNILDYKDMQERIDNLILSYERAKRFTK